MGHYIQTPEPRRKADQLKNLHGAYPAYDHRNDRLPRPSDLGENEVLICVVENPQFDAAGIVFNDHEFNSFSHPDGRRKEWLILPKNKVVELCPSAKHDL